MKKFLSFVLVLVLVLSMFTVTGSASSRYDYDRHVFKDMYGGTFVFSEAVYDYGVRYYTATGEYLTSPLIIVSDDCLVKYRAATSVEVIGSKEEGEIGSAYYAGGITRTLSSMRGKSVVTEYMEMYVSEGHLAEEAERVYAEALEEAKKEALEDGHVPEFGEEMEDILAEDVFTTESAITEGAIETTPQVVLPEIEPGSVGISYIYDGFTEKYDVRDRILFLHAEGGYLVGVMTESTALAHAGMVVNSAPVISKHDSVLELGKGYVNEDGLLSYDYVISNRGSGTMEGHYAILTYHKAAHTVNGVTCKGVQITPLELSLAEGKTKTGTLVSDYGELTSSVIKFVKFDSVEEYEAFFAQEGFEYKDHMYCPRYNVTGAMADTLTR